MSRTTRRDFLKTSAAAVTLPLPSGAAKGSAPALDGFTIAGRHKFVSDIPTPNFFEGMLLGNGDLGVCVTVRPDALGLHLGKEDSWDIRVSEDHYRHVLPFAELLKLWQQASDEAKRQGKPDMVHMENKIDFLRRYNERVVSSYRKPWPRPWPCGIVWIHWDPRMIRLRRQALDPSSGLLTIDLEYDDLRGRRGNIKATCFVSRATNHICVCTERPAPFLSVAYYPNRDKEAGLPPPELVAASTAGDATFECFQRFPAAPPSEEVAASPVSEKDSSFALCARLAGKWRDDTSPERVFLHLEGRQPFRLDLTVFTPRDHPDNVSHARSETARLSAIVAERLQGDSESAWRMFWSRSAVELQDRELERIWYHNQYFLACCLKEGKVAPGLFGNWTSGRIGTAWHGDYHMNYNTQQVFWGVFSSNHADQHLPYVELCEKLLPMAEAFAREKFGLPGAFFPHSAYPVPSQVVPYPALPWGYEVCETPWTVQSLWWHYLYTLDREYLERAYPLMRAAARFLASYVKQGEDGKYHIIPTVSPENWGCTVDFRLNRDCIMDLALTEFLLDAVVKASEILDVDHGERSRWSEIRTRVAAYPNVDGPFGEVWVDVVDAPAEWIYNVPVTLAPVFPGEQVGLGSTTKVLELARRTASTVRLEGGNDLVYQPLIRARLGMLDLEWFKREVRYCLLPNGVCNDRVRQIGGRYSDLTDPDFMMRMGVWTENLSLPAVLNECMLQSYDGTLRIFPNTSGLGPARFENLRAVGAFLVSAAWDGKNVSSVRILSERGAPVRLFNPWKSAIVSVTRLRDNAPCKVSRDGDMLLFDTTPGEHYMVESRQI